MLEFRDIAVELFQLLGFYYIFEQEQIIQVTCAMLNGDKRFGFSVIGGREEGFPPCIDEITPGMLNPFLTTITLYFHLIR